MKNKRVTLEQIAKEINISRVTISKFLNGKGNLRDVNRIAVMEALERYGYRQNFAAKSLAMNRTFSVGFVCFDSPRSPYFLKTILAGVEEAQNQFLDYGLHVHTRVTNIDYPEQQLEAVQSLVKDRMDAIAIIPTDIFKPDVAQQIALLVDNICFDGIPVITVNRDIPHSKRTAYIGCDYKTSGMMAAELLAKFVKEGEILVSLASRNVQLIDVRSRLEGLIEVFADYPKLTIVPHYYYEGDNEAYIRHIQDFIQSSPCEKGLLDISYQLQHVAEQVQQNNKHLYIVGFDQYLGYESHMNKHLVDCIVTQDMFAQGYQAINYMFQLILQDNQEIDVMPIKNEIIIASNLSSYA